MDATNTGRSGATEHSGLTSLRMSGRMANPMLTFITPAVTRSVLIRSMSRQPPPDSPAIAIPHAASVVGDTSSPKRTRTSILAVNVSAASACESRHAVTRRGIAMRSMRSGANDASGSSMTSVHVLSADCRLLRSDQRVGSATAGNASMSASVSIGSSASAEYDLFAQRPPCRGSDPAADWRYLSGG